MIINPSLIEGTTLSSFIKENPYLIFISPDQGAAKKVRQWSEYFNRRMICATKIRDEKNGEISKTKINLGYSHYTNMHEDFLIIDDICDDGKKFIELSKNIRKQRIIGNLYLYVTHGIFARGLGPLLPYFKKIYCYHTFLLPDKIKKDYLEIIGVNHDYESFKCD